MGEGVNECAPLHLGNGRWIAVIRTHSPANMHLLRSTDDGATWIDTGSITRPSEHPAHLLRLADGRVLLTYGNRINGQRGVDARFSSDEGATWTPAVRLIDLPEVDLGYPSSVQLADGKIVTAYYAAKGPGHDGYHMGVVIWSLPE